MEVILLNDQSSQTTHGQYQQYQRCDLCNVPIYRNPCSDIRNSGAFQGKGGAVTSALTKLQDMPTEQAIQALNNAYEIYKEPKP